jgi:tRNA-2-methylthio-N6-dimethylallyladenosine synthase
MCRVRGRAAGAGEPVRGRFGATAVGPYAGEVTKRYLVRTFGCQMNEHDSERLAGLLEADGYVPTTDVEDADVVVLNTCCIRENADNKLYGTLGHLKSVKDRHPGMEIVVAGCLAQKDQEVVAERAPYVDVVLGTHNVHRAVELLHEHQRTGLPVLEVLAETVAEDHELFPSALPVVREVGHSAWVTIQIGCDNSCAFCIVPAVRGPEISRPFGDVVAEVERAAADGVTQVTLLGQNVNSFGRDLTLRLRPSDGPAGVGADPSFLAGAAWAEDGAGRVRPLFADLLRAVGSVPGIRRVRYTSPHPKDLRPETITAMADVPTVCEHLHLPLQSGSDRTLARMHRGYTAERYLRRLADARAAIPDLAVTTDIIVGFPGETDADFGATLQVAAEARYDNAFTFVYSPRPGTEAAASADPQVPADVAAERMARLRTVVERTSRAGHRARIGRTEEVLVEGPSRRDPDRLSGRTRHNRLVHFPSAEHLRPGTYATVLVTDATTTHLSGELVEIVSAPAHRTRIPVRAG